MERSLSNHYVAQRRKREEEARLHGPRQIHWTLTFSDLLTLLLTMFVLRFSMYSLPKKTLNDSLVNYPTRAVGLGGDRADENIVPQDYWLSTLPGSRERLAAMSDSLSRILGAPEPETESGNGKRFGSGLILTTSHGMVTASLLRGAFANQNDELTFEAAEAVRTIGKTFGTPEFEIRISSTAVLSGDQENDFASDADLSTARGMAVLRQFLDAGVDAQVLSLGSYGGAQRGVIGRDYGETLPDERVDISIRLRMEKAVEPGQTTADSTK